VEKTEETCPDGQGAGREVHVYSFQGFKFFRTTHAPVSARCGARWRRNSCSDEVCACVVFGGRSQAHIRRTDGRGGTVLNPCEMSEFGVWRGPAGIWEFLQGFEAFADIWFLPQNIPQKWAKIDPGGMQIKITGVD